MEFARGDRFVEAPAVTLYLLIKLIMNDSVLDVTGVFIVYAASGPPSNTSLSAEPILPLFFLLCMLGVLFGLGIIRYHIKKRYASM